MQKGLTQEKCKSFLTKKVAIVLFASFIIISCHFLSHYYGLNYLGIFLFIESHPVIAPLLFLCVYVVGVVIMFPTLPFNLGAGVLFGGVWGGVLATLGSTMGALVAFLLVRSLPSIQQYRFLNNKYVNWINDEIQKNEWRLVAFTRLCSALPTGLVNYLFGLTRIKFTVYFWATLIFLFPPSLIVSIIGQHMGTYFLSGRTTSILHEVSIVLTGLALLVFIIPFVFQKLYKIDWNNKGKFAGFVE